jgi:hypothetical protein
MEMALPFARRREMPLRFWKKKRRVRLMQLGKAHNWRSESTSFLARQDAIEEQSAPGGIHH